MYAGGQRPRDRLGLFVKESPGPAGPARGRVARVFGPVQAAPPQVRFRRRARDGNAASPVPLGWGLWSCSAISNGETAMLFSHTSLYNPRYAHRL